MGNEKNEVKFKRLSWDSEFYLDLITGNGFEITEPSEVSIDGIKRKALYGSQSPLYGTTYEDEHSFSERFRCECGTFKSRKFEGEICPFCNTPVKERGSNVNMTGWISIGKERIINPYYFNLLEQTLGKAVINDIVFDKRRINKDGRVELLEDDDENRKNSKAGPFYGIGIVEFHSNYENILQYFVKKKKNKVSVIENLIKEKDKVFTSHIPIATPLLRPQSVTNDTFYFSSVNKLVNTMYSIKKNLMDVYSVERPFLIQRLQTKVNTMWDTYFKELNGKHGMIRGDLLGGSINFSARNVIILDPTLKDNELDISYYTFLEVFKYHIIYYIMKLEDVTLAKAYKIWNDAKVFNDKVYEVMKFIIKTRDCRVLLNRNPTINFYSMLLMKIRDVIYDDSNFALSIPLSILPGLNADFDGDILNLVGLLNSGLIYMFRKFDPIRRMIISRDSGLINEYFSIIKSQLADLSYFSNIGKCENDREQTFMVLDKDKNKIYLPIEEIKKNKMKKVALSDYYYNN